MTPEPAADYDALLQRAKSKLPGALSSGERFQLPELDIQQEGKVTMVRNFGDVLDKVRRQEKDVVPILLREIGTAGTYADGRLTLQGRVPQKTIEDRVQAYIDLYVICSECGRPDTHLEKQERTLILRCEACGGHRPVRVRKIKEEVVKPEAAVVEGKTYEVMIEDTGRRGDGVARIDRFTIFVKGAKKGQAVKVKINNVSGTMAFGDVVLG